MFRRRTSLSLSAAAALLVAAPLLTACGSEAHPGAAAVVDGDRITVAQVQSRVAAVRDAQRATEQGDQLIENTGQLARGTLGNMVFQRVLERAAQDAGVTVSRGEVQRTRKEAERNVGGAEALRAMVLQQQAVAPDEIDDVVRVQLLVQGLADRLGADQRTPEGQEEIQAVLTEASEAMDVDVNPRYGVWDDEKTSLGDTEFPWVRDVTGGQRPA